ncbi:MAG: sigma-70 family RNA polymerase sigma factor [Polyangiaceae bacterium]
MTERDALPAGIDVSFFDAEIDRALAPYRRLLSEDDLGFMREQLGRARPAHCATAARCSCTIEESTEASSARGAELFQPPSARTGLQDDGEVRDAALLVANNMEIVIYHARQLARQLGRNAVEEESCRSRKGARPRREDHDPAPAPFALHAMRKVRAMLDFARRDTHVRAAGVRRRARAMLLLEEVTAAPISEPPPPPTEEDHLSAFREALAAQAGAVFVGLTASDEAEESDTPENDLIRARARAALTAALTHLPARERALIEGHYFRGERFDEMAEGLKISKSRVSRLHTRALASLGELLKDHA